MELGLREWLIIGGAIVVVLIVLDGWRRMRGGGNNLKMKIDQTMVDLPEDDYNPELPGGGARVLDKDGNPVAERQEPTFDELPTIGGKVESLSDSDMGGAMGGDLATQDDPLFISPADGDLLSAPRKTVTASSPADQQAAALITPTATTADTERDPLFESLDEGLTNSVDDGESQTVHADSELTDSEQELEPEPLAHLDEGISAVRVVTAPEPESDDLLAADTARDNTDDDVPLIDTIVRSGKSAEIVQPTPVADIDPLFTDHQPDEDGVEVAVAESAESVVEQPEPIAEAPVLIEESTEESTEVSPEAPVAEVTDEFAEETAETAPLVAPVAEVQQEDTVLSDKFTEAESSETDTPKPELADLETPEEDIAPVEVIDDIFAQPEPEPESDVAAIETDTAVQDQVTVEDDVLDLTFLHQMDQAAVESSADPIDNSDEQLQAEPESVIETAEHSDVIQSEMPFEPDHGHYHGDDDEDLIAALPDDFALPADAIDTADEHDEADLDLSRPITELMQVSGAGDQPQQAAMDLQPEPGKAVTEPLEEDVAVAISELPSETNAAPLTRQERQEPTFGEAPLFAVEETAGQPALDDTVLPSLSALDDAELPEGELVSPAMQVPMTGAEPEPAVQADGQSLQKVPEADKVLVISVVAAKDRAAFNGRNLLQILIACGMRYGDMKIFHRYEDGIDQGAIQFSMANAVEPGYFDIDQMEQLETRGVTFFMSMEEPRDVMNAYECMLGTAEAVAKNLHGNLLDENRSTMRSQTKEHYRERIRRFEMRKLKQSSGA